MDNKLRGFGRGRAAGGKWIYCWFLKKFSQRFNDGFFCKALRKIKNVHTIFDGHMYMSYIQAI